MCLAMLDNSFVFCVPCSAKMHANTEHGTWNTFVVRLIRIGLNPWSIQYERGKRVQYSILDMFAEHRMENIFGEHLIRMGLSHKIPYIKSISL
jgi:hypothetical protein